jgi:hypothetical protein
VLLRCSDRVERDTLLHIISQFPEAGAALRRYTINLALRRYMLDALEVHRKAKAEVAAKQALTMSASRRIRSTTSKKGMQLLRAKTKNSILITKAGSSKLRIVHTARKGTLEWICEQHEALSAQQKRLSTDVSSLRYDVGRLIAALVPASVAPATPEGSPGSRRASRGSRAHSLEAVMEGSLMQHAAEAVASRCFGAGTV